jgi:nucleoside-diphosphate-sugar epimerase
MKALLTGITGNLGYEVSLDLLQRGFDLIPCIRPGKIGVLLAHQKKFDEVIECDLTEREIEYSGTVDCIVHCAGIVHFRDSHDKNEVMMRRVVALAKKLNVPVYFVSTAFVYRPDDSVESFNNRYEHDKFNAERVLVKSGLPHSIFRPSVLTGHSRTGEIRNFTGFYQIARAFISAVQSSRAKNQVLRFPKMLGESNMVPVDQAAASIGTAIHSNRLETQYVTNPDSPRSEWVLEETLSFFSLRDSVRILDVSFKEFGGLDLTEEEVILYKVSQHFSPYWSMDYSFPPSICEKNLIHHDYMVKILTVFQNSEISHGQKSY